MVNGGAEFFSDGAGVQVRGAGDKDPAVALPDFGGDLDHVFRSLSSTEDYLGESFAKGAMSVDAGKAEVDRGRRLERAQGVVDGSTAMFQIGQKLSGFGICHGREDVTEKGWGHAGSRGFSIPGLRVWA